MVPFFDAKALVRFYTCALNFCVCSCGVQDEKLDFAEVVALVYQYTIGYTGLD